jgi:hypothetical protein
MKVRALALAVMVVAACHSSESGEDGAIRWSASAETEASLGVHSWRLEGPPDKAELSGLSDGAEGEGKAVFHAVIDRTTPGRVVIDVDLPSIWHLDYASDRVPATSGVVSDRVGGAFAASASELASRVLPTPGLLTPKLYGPPGAAQPGSSNGGLPSATTPGTPTCLLQGDAKALSDAPGAAAGAVAATKDFNTCLNDLAACRGTEQHNMGEPQCGSAEDCLHGPAPTGCPPG